MSSEKALTAILGELEDDDSEPIDGDSEEADELIQEPQNAEDDETSFDSDIEVEPTEGMPFVEGKDGEKWFHVPVVVQRRVNAENIFTKKPGFIKSALKSAYTPASAFGNFMDEIFLAEIVKYTNIFIEKNRPNTKPITVDQLKVFLGSVLLIGALKGKNSQHREFWSKNYGYEIIKKSISCNRFEEISQCIRFDQKHNRNRKDKLAPIRIIFKKFIEKCKKNYVPSTQMTIDEQLVTFRGRCPFRMYIPSKPGRYGIKIWALCDATNAYLYNAKVYIGKEDGVTEIGQGENVVKWLSEPVLKAGRNITTDNFFTTLSLARYLLSFKTTLVGTVRKNKRFLPPDFQSSKGEMGAIKFLFQEKVTIVKFNGKKNKSVVLMSTQHKVPAIDQETKKPEIITYYNSTKAGVDTLDQVIRCYSVKRATRRWPMAIFYNMVDTAAYNAFLLFKQSHPQFWSKEPFQARRAFLKMLAEELLDDNSEAPVVQIQQPKRKPSSNVRGFCFLCTTGKREKTRLVCDICDRFVCENHRAKKITCDNCS